jgi:23S rRNA (adenine2503-C2)-methyltransferase
VYETEDGYRVESVLYAGSRLCVSTQVGCPVRCAFCASGSRGFFRNLSAQEIITQWELIKDRFFVKGVALAGIGEPACNVDGVVDAVERFRSAGLKVTISTTGFPIDGFRRLLGLNHNGITVSLHTVDEEKRKQLFGLSEELSEILGVLDSHLSGISSSRRKRLWLGYLLIKGVNDSEEELRLLGAIATTYRVGVVLMSYNKVSGSPFEPLPRAEYERAFLLLKGMGVRVTLSNRFRTDRLGGCGTLTIARRV